MTKKHYFSTPAAPIFILIGLLCSYAKGLQKMSLVFSFKVFQDGGQTVNFEAKDYKDIFWRPFTYLHSKPIRMKIGAVGVEK